MALFYGKATVQSLCRHALALKNAKNDCFTTRASATQPFDSPGAEVAFINFDLLKNRSLLFTIRGYALSQSHEISIHSISVQACDESDLRGVQIKGKKLYELSEFCL